MSPVQKILGFFLLQISCIRVSNGVNKKAIVKIIEDDINKLKANNVKCIKGDLNTIRRLKCERNLDKALLCLGEKLLANGGSLNGELWTLLGEIYQRQGKTTKGTKCFKEAVKISGKFTGQIALWHFLGPFQIGKSEIDGDPIENFGGINEILCTKYSKKFVVYSELVPEGELKWSTITPNKTNGLVTVRPAINWQQLAYGLFSFAVVEWQGWLVGDLAVNAEMTVLIQCLGVSTIYIDGNILAGDLYSRNYFWHPVHLKPGVHSVLLRARAAGQMMFSCNFASADQATSFEIQKPSIPDLVDGHLFSNQFVIPVSNRYAAKWLTVTKITLLSQTEGPDISLHIDKTQTLTIAPGQIHSIIASFQLMEKTLKECPSKDIQGVLQLKTKEGAKDETDFSIRCRKKTQSFLFTFIDHDGSLQIAAAIFPLGQKETDLSYTYPVLLSLHGTSIHAQNQADSYKRKENDAGEYIFGVEGMWTLAPTRHGAHNWEGPGELTALTSLERLAEITLEHDWISAKANSKAVVFTGHSMGGHGAWQLSIHRPDIALAVVSIAGWINKENYGESNVFFKHDISTSHVDASVKQIMESCVMENDAEKHVSNLRGVPVMIRTGGEDNTVMPYFSKRMYRILKEQGNNVTYTELADKSHWWWDSYKTNDGGATNDPDIRKFLKKHSKFAVKRSSTLGCSTNEEKTSCDDEDVSKYSAAEIPNRNLARSGEFLLTVYNPASSHGVRGVQVIQQATPFRKTIVHMQFTEAKVAIVTSNVIRLKFSEPAVSPVHWNEKQIKVDGVEISSNGNNVFEICAEKSKIWEICDVGVNSETNRGLFNLGPARRVAESSLLIVVGTSSKSETNQALLQMAVYLANQFYFTSDSIVPIIRDKETNGENIRNSNLIIIGEIPSTRHYLENVSLQFGGDQAISLGQCRFQFINMGLLSLVPHAGSRLALVITGTSLSSIRDVIHLATPTIPPMARSPFSNFVPDYVITGPDFRAQGPGGYLCAGFWGNRWEYRTDISSCAC